ncbi:HAD-IA family hydrolase [Deinococcus yavapaiensis]|uniref:HAD superfamily hydrolase (TIGR01509 family)/HAD superfamily hydrolase (TIGR01549 family) n=1 Tax=Deinococcus yavapaiensis KR-236 TaxID=694435 RepID=A0A318SJA2_9DEIO|nr:HAD-IA family hydrolase [Deinococcus yavapaiensis]PYE52013.1 HAD superfamily hydrolase (TIGR01509 family)/HAD superfamily hydrolase (TIGR01549 family) [Deinococcus yavapaiensis KR-236]
MLATSPLPVHPLVRAFIFDLDDTLAATGHLKSYCATQDREALQRALHDLTPHPDLEVVLQRLTTHVPLAAAVVGTRVYAETLLTHLFPSVTWTAIVTYEDVARAKPYPDVFELAAKRLNVDAANVVVVGDHRDDMEAAYHAGMQAALCAWHDADADAYAFVPDAFLFEPNDLLTYLTSPALARPLLEGYLLHQDEAASQRQEPIPVGVHVPGHAPFLVDVLGRYFPNFNRTLHLHRTHPLSRQIALKERPEPFPVPDAWRPALRALAEYAAATWHVDTITVVPTKPGKDARLERILDVMADASPHVDVTFDAHLLAFQEGTPSIKHLPAASRFPTVKAGLSVRASCTGRRVLVLDDVITQGATLLAALQRLREAGAVDVRGAALAKTISGTMFRVQKETLTCPECGADLQLLSRRSDGRPFWGCANYRFTGCWYTQPY